MHATRHNERSQEGDSIKVELNTNEENTWCPGCTNFGILAAVKRALTELSSQSKIDLLNTVVVTGIGCHAKLYDYIGTSGIYGLHGRVLPVSMGVKLGNKELTVIGFGGDGDTFAEGSSHFLHASRYNVDMTMLVHNNQLFALTTGQATPTSPKGFKGKSTPDGFFERALNPLGTALINGASFVARSYALDPKLSELIQQAIKHRGFSLIEIIQPCITFDDTREFVSSHSYQTKHDTTDLQAALKLSQEWSYELDASTKIPMGLFYKQSRAVYTDNIPQLDGPLYKKKHTPNLIKIFDEFY
ncbi:MAG: 2-oxoacid:ferredoxin oxidoreductase subunit beta [Candidatus Altiarchaeota archaeon]|nr:2-oxoacid:ferredoxin oxidoreductase subunit beta [Candidatus Altiarchaeota archaeon]